MGGFQSEVTGKHAHSPAIREVCLESGGFESGRYAEGQMRGSRTIRMDSQKTELLKNIGEQSVRLFWQEASLYQGADKLYCD